MAKHRLLTQLAVDRAKARPGGRYQLRDGPGGVPGLALRVSESGVKTFALRYRVNGRQPRMTLGQHPGMTLAAARTAARGALEMASRGEDPAAAKAEGKREDDCNSVRAVAVEYATRHLRRNTKRWRDAEQTLARDVLPRWGERPIQSIGRRDVRDLLDSIVDRGAPVAANRTLSLVKHLLNWAVERGIIEVNAAAGIKPPHKEAPRQRTLTEAELRSIWPALQTMDWPFGALGRLLLLLGQRRGEIAGLRWSDLDLEAGVLHLPSAATKTATEHLLPLSRAAVELIRALPRIGDSPLVFPASRIGSTRPISGFSKALLTAQRLSGTTGWHWHDLRRSTATGMAKLNVGPHVVERILNHSGGATMSVIARTYNVHSYKAEMRAALELWAAELDRIVTGSEAKVVPLRPSAKL